ncbi:MAG: hypothetical protein AAF244_01415 [Pseudomonadota bacterium]
MNKSFNEISTTTDMMPPFTLGSDLLAQKEIIDKLDLEPIKFKLMKEEGWSLEQVDEIEPLYKGYLFLHIALPHLVHVPTEAIDEMWHTHILDTQKYMKDCLECFGYYLHHYPYLGINGEEDYQDLQDKFAVTEKLYKDVLGLNIHQKNATGCGGGCGGCSGGGSSCSSASCSGKSSCSSGGGGAACSGSNSDHDKKKEKEKKLPQQPPKKSPWSWVPGLRMQNFFDSLRLEEKDNASRPNRKSVEELEKKSIH